MTGVVSLVVSAATVGVAGGVRSICSSPLVESVLSLPAASVTRAVTDTVPAVSGVRVVPLTGVAVPRSRVQDPLAAGVTV